MTVSIPTKQYSAEGTKTNVMNCIPIERELHVLEWEGRTKYYHKPVKIHVIA